MSSAAIFVWYLRVNGHTNFVSRFGKVHNVNPIADQNTVLGRVAQSVAGLTRARGPRFDTQSGHILSFLLPLIQERQLSVTGESMCTKYWLTA